MQLSLSRSVPTSCCWWATSSKARKRPFTPGWLPVLQEFRAPHGVYVVTGNHEFYAGGMQIIDLFRRAGFHVLRDESVEPIPGLILTGVNSVVVLLPKLATKILLLASSAKPMGSLMPLPLYSVLTVE